MLRQTNKENKSIQISRQWKWYCLPSLLDCYVYYVVVGYCL